MDSDTRQAPDCSASHSSNRHIVASEEAVFTTVGMIGDDRARKRCSGDRTDQYEPAPAERTPS